MANNNKKHYYYKNRPRKQNQDGAQEQQIALFSSEQLAKSITELGISETTCALLEKNRIQTAADLVKRTEKDMYKVQGLNKKILFEVKDALKANGMCLRAEQVNKQDKPQKQDGEAQKEKNAESQAATRRRRRQRQAKLAKAAKERQAAKKRERSFQIRSCGQSDFKRQTTKTSTAKGATKQAATP